MNVNNDENIERLLQDSGARWRAALPPPGDFNVQQLSDVAGASTAWALPTVGAVAGMLLVAVVAFVIMSRSGVPPAGSSEPSTSATHPSGSFAHGTASGSPSIASPDLLPLAVVHPGDLVVATGTIIDDGVAPVLCQTLSSRTRVPSCAGPPGVGIMGVDPHDVQGSMQGDVWVTHVVLVNGTWVGNAIDVTRMVVASEVPQDDPPAPCETPTGGWPMSGTSDEMVEASGRLHAYVAAHPDLYSGIWAAFPANTDPSSDNVVVVVGTTGDVESETQTLRQMYPFALCVTAAEFSARELSEVQDRLSTAGRPWVVDLQPSIDRVVVSVSVVDEETAALLAPYVERIIVEALVNRSDELPQ